MSKQLFIDADQKAKEVASKKKRESYQNPFDQINKKLALMSKLTLKDKVTFYRLFTTMINAGISITKALGILKGQVASPKLKVVLEDIENRIKSGASLSKGLEDFSDDFSEAEIGMIKAGEVSGKLNETLLNLADQAEKSDSITKKLKGAMIYPVAILLVLVVAMFAVMTYVIPQIKDMFDSFGADLPWITQSLIDFSDFMISTGGPLELMNVYNILISMALSFFMFQSFKKTKTGRELWDSFILKIPVFGSLVQKVVIAKMSRGLSTLLSSGIPMVKGITICSSMVGNEKYKKRILRIAEDVKIGITIADNLKNDFEYFPPIVISMIGVGEQTANLDKVTMKIASFYEEEVDDLIKNLSSLLEPMIIVLVGITVGGLVVAIMLPILSLSDLAAA